MRARSLKNGKKVKKGAKGTSPRRKPAAKPRTLAERFANIVGRAPGLPPDASVNHDHYLYGAPKRQ